MGKKLGDHLFKGVVKEKAQEKLRAAAEKFLKKRKEQETTKTTVPDHGQ